VNFQGDFLVSDRLNFDEMAMTSERQIVLLRVMNEVDGIMEVLQLAKFGYS
jgi:hypothetical protein